MIERFVEALQERDTEAICNELMGLGTPVERRECERDFEQEQEPLVPPDVDPESVSEEIEWIDIDGDAARVSFGELAWSLEREGGRWTLEGFR